LPGRALSLIAGAETFLSASLSGGVEEEILQLGCFHSGGELTGVCSVVVVLPLRTFGSVQTWYNVATFSILFLSILWLRLLYMLLYCVIHFPAYIVY